MPAHKPSAGYAWPAPKQVPIRFDPALLERMRAWCKDNRCSLAVMVRRAVIELLEREERW